MAQRKKTSTPEVEEQSIPDVTPEESSQAAVRESMDVDPSTGATVRMGVPETPPGELVQEFLVWLEESANASNADSMAMLADMLRQAQTVETVADALKETTTIVGKEFIGIPFLMTGFTIRHGNFEGEELPYYASIDAQHPNYPGGLVVNCGGMKILVHLQTLERIGQWPIPVCITGKETRKGHTVLSFELLKQNPR